MSVSFVQVVQGEFRKCKRSFDQHGRDTACTTGWEGEAEGKGSEAGVVEATGHGGLMSHLQHLVPYSVNTQEPQTG